MQQKSLYPELAKTNSNLVLLTPREHYIAHWLLLKIYPGKSMTYAFLVMCNKASNKNFNRDYKINSKTYAKLKKDFSNNNPSKLERIKAKISKAKKGKNHHYYGKRGNELPGYKADIIELEHKDGTTFKGTRTEAYTILPLTPAQVSNLISGYRQTIKGWQIKGKKLKYKDCKGKNASNADLTMYQWYNTKTGFGYVCDHFDFQKYTNINKKSIQSLIYQTRKSVYGWILLNPKQKGDT